MGSHYPSRFAGHLFDLRDAHKLLSASIILEIGLVLIFVAGESGIVSNQTVTQLFNLGAEQNIPTWFSSIQLFLIGLVFLDT